MKLGELIGTYRKKYGLSQENLAEAVEASQTHISNIERGKDNPSLELLQKIAAALECELFIDFIPIGSHREHSEPDFDRVDTKQSQAGVPTWLTLENARAITMFGIAYQKLELEKETLTEPERKALEGIIETCKTMLNNQRKNCNDL